MESFTIDVSDIQDDSATINLTWARVRVPIKVESDLVPDLLVKIKASMDSPDPKSRGTYLQAATFYWITPRRIWTQALSWVNGGTGDPSAHRIPIAVSQGENSGQAWETATAPIAAANNPAIGQETKGRTVPTSR